MVALRAGSAASLARILELNRAHEVELSPLGEEELRALVGCAFFAGATADGGAFLIALDQDAEYQSPNFAWFRQRFPSFVYVDRLAVEEGSRGRGHARRLYRALFAAAAAAGHGLVACEVNVEPPNPPSDALHASLGFEEVGRSTLSSGKTVRYLCRRT